MDKFTNLQAPAMAAGCAVQPLEILEDPLRSEESDLQRLTVAALARRGAHETELFLRRQKYDSRFCYELFRRAIEERDDQAWDRIYAQYHVLVTNWVYKHSLFAATGEAPAYFANRAFEKLWNSVPAERFNRFPDLRSILRYLQLCVHSVIVDYMRSAEWAEPEEEADSHAAASPDVQDQVLDRMQYDELWRWLNAHLHDDRERTVVYGTYVLDLKPRELYDQHPRLFSSVAEIYRVKQNVLARLRRDPEMGSHKRSSSGTQSSAVR